MRVVRVYSGPDGRSHFEETTMPLRRRSPHHGSFPLELPRDAEVAVGTSFALEFHNAPGRMYYILLGGSIDVVSTTGESRSVRAGDLLLLEDTVGEGHIFRMVDGDRWTALLYHLE